MTGNGSTALATTREPWEKRPKESYKAFAAFALYRDLGPVRTHAKVQAEIGKGRTLVEGWSRRHDWAERVELYDVYMDRRRREAYETELEQASRRQAGIGQVLQTLSMRRLRGAESEGLVEGVEGYFPALSPGMLGPQDVARLAEVGVRIERLALGQATDLIAKAQGATPQEVARIVGAAIDVALDLLPEEMHDLYMARLREKVGR